MTDEVAKKVNGVILSPDADEGFSTALAAAKKAAIPVVLVNSDSTYNNNPDKILPLRALRSCSGTWPQRRWGTYCTGQARWR